MIILNKISLAFGQRTIFNDVSYNINKSNRIGLVGRNGSGKSTLLKIVAGQQSVDSGSVEIEKNSKIGYMPQEVVLQSNKTIYKEALSAFPEIYKLLGELSCIEKNMGESHELSGKDVDRYAQIHERLLELDAARAEVEIKKMLVGLGFSQNRFDEPIANLSVGWRMRVVLAKLLLQKADFYLFDEPTNHLDIVTKDWFLNFLQSSNFGFMIVCHDRYFLDHLCSKTLELENGKATLYHGNYTVYAQQKEERATSQEQAALKQQKELTKKMKTVERFRASASKSKMAQAMLKKIEKTERIETTRTERTIAFSFPPVTRSGKVVLKADGVAHAFDNNNIFQDVSFEVERGEKVAIVAPNGIGKTTLFNLVTGKLPLQTGTITPGYHVEPVLFEQDQDKVLDKNNTIYNEVESICTDSETRTLIRKFLGAFLFSGDDVDKKIRVLSGGEKNRVAMVKVLLQRGNLLLLDEPTNHLDIQSKEILLSALHQFKGTVLFVSHDRDFLDKLATRILELSPSGVISYPGNYESYLYHKKKNEQAQELANIPKKPSKQKTAKTNKEQYELRRAINKLEGKINRLETKIQDLNTKLEDYEYGTNEFTSTFEALSKAQKDLETTVEAWEALISQHGAP